MGTVYEQQIKARDVTDVLTIRLVTLELDPPIRDGDAAIPLLTNVSATECALVIADWYRLHGEEQPAYTMS
jgi:hypothetical protein